VADELLHTVGELVRAVPRVRLGGVQLADDPADGGKGGAPTQVPGAACSPDVGLASAVALEPVRESLARDELPKVLADVLEVVVAAGAHLAVAVHSCHDRVQAGVAVQDPVGDLNPSGLDGPCAGLQPDGLHALGAALHLDHEARGGLEARVVGQVDHGNEAAVAQPHQSRCAEAGVGRLAPRAVPRQCQHALGAMLLNAVLLRHPQLAKQLIPQELE